MTNQQLIQDIIAKNKRIEQMPPLPKELKTDFLEQEIKESVYYSAKIEGSSIKRKDIK